MTEYPRTAVEWAMKIHEVILRAMAKIIALLATLIRTSGALWWH